MADAADLKLQFLRFLCIAEPIKFSAVYLAKMAKFSNFVLRKIGEQKSPRSSTISSTVYQRPVSRNASRPRASNASNAERVSDAIDIVKPGCDEGDLEDCCIVKSDRT